MQEEIGKWSESLRLPTIVVRFVHNIGSHMSKCTIYRDYKDACNKMPVPPVDQSTFYNLWSAILASIGTMKPSSDLCFECQQNISRIIHSAHLLEDVTMHSRCTFQMTPSSLDLPTFYQQGSVKYLVLLVNLWQAKSTISSMRERLLERWKGANATVS